MTPSSPSVLQTLASIRLSQLKHDDARAALNRSLSLWKNLDPSDPSIPDFPTRISLARLLMEAEMEDEALEVLERLTLEDDQSVEACYLGGWCLHLSAEKKREKAIAKDGMGEAGEENREIMGTLRASRSWLMRTLKMYEELDYEDARLKEHTEEILEQLSQVLGPPPKDGEEEEEDEWEGIEEDDDDDAEDGASDEEMAGM